MLKAKNIAKILLYVLESCILALAVTFLMHLSSQEVVAQWEQPAEITYDGRGPYYMSIVEDDIDWRGFPFFDRRNYFVYLGRDSGTPYYGHRIKYSFPGCYPEDTEHLKSFLSEAKVQWTTDGVTLELPSGHRLFVPKKMFIGGR